jgi:hypothetical protein
MGDQEQQQQLLAAAFAAQSQMAAAYGPMANMYNPYAMYNGFFGGGGGGQGSLPVPSYTLILLLGRSI